MLLVVLPPVDLPRGVSGKKRDLTLERRFCFVSEESNGLEAVFWGDPGGFWGSLFRDSEDALTFILFILVVLSLYLDTDRIV